MAAKKNKSEARPNNLTEEQSKLFAVLTPLQKKIVTHVIAGLKPSEAHREAGGTCKQEHNRGKLANQILSNPAVKSFLDAVQYETVNEAIMNRAEMLERLTNLARINMNDLVTFKTLNVATLDDNGEVEKVEGQTVWSINDSALQDPYALASISEVTASKEGIKIKQHSPLAAMKQLAEMEGYNKPVEVEVSHKLTPWDSMNVGVTRASDLEEEGDD